MTSLPIVFSITFPGAGTPGTLKFFRYLPKFIVITWRLFAPRLYAFHWWSGFTATFDSTLSASISRTDVVDALVHQAYPAAPTNRTREKRTNTWITRLDGSIFQNFTYWLDISDIACQAGFMAHVIHQYSFFITMYKEPIAGSYEQGNNHCNMSAKQ